jgi:flagellar basal-body rod protein FlgB
MADFLFGSTVGVLKDALGGAATAQSVYANNVANVNTPDFRRSEVSFKDALARVAGEQPDPDELQMVKTDRRDFPDDDTQQVFSATTTVDNTEQMRVDGSNVDIDQEMAKLSLNSAYQQTMGQLLTTQYARLRRAITDSLS